jgi:hypothetical protein
VPYCTELRVLGKRRGVSRIVQVHLTRSRKTTIAIEFCHRWQEAKPAGQIFWVHGDSYDTFIDSYMELGRETDTLIGGKDEEMRLEHIKEWLDSDLSGEWIMVVDNFENLDKRDEVDLRRSKFLPVKRGAILFTARDGSILGNLVPPNAGLDIKAMNDTEALEMSRGLGLPMKPPI